MDPLVATYTSDDLPLQSNFPLCTNCLDSALVALTQDEGTPTWEDEEN